MSARRPYAEGTSVSVVSSQNEINSTIERYGASGFMLGWDQDMAVVAFVAHDRQVRFQVQTKIPLDDPAIVMTPGGKVRPVPQRKGAMEAETRRRWRALALAIKAKLEVVESGIATFEEEFMAHVVLPDGKTFAEHATPAIQRAYDEGGPPTLALNPGGDA